MDVIGRSWISRWTDSLLHINSISIFALNIHMIYDVYIETLNKFLLFCTDTRLQTVTIVLPIHKIQGWQIIQKHHEEPLRIQKDAFKS